MIRTKLAKATVAGGIATISTLALAGPALASPPDLNGGRISWNSQVPCSDGASGVYVNTAPKYSAPGGGTYRARLVLYTSPGGRLGLGTLWQWNVSGAATLAVPRWSTSSSYTGEAYTTLYVYKWNGSAYALVARESIPCL